MSFKTRPEGAERVLQRRNSTGGPMPDARDRLTAALADRYTLERQLGEGGMATVYLAKDLKHDRKVALKVLKPELAAVLGADRFVQEIKTTAALQHPHILPLFDSGTAGQQDGGTAFLYYVMPFIEGETVRDKLDRETQLSIEEAVRITTEVADALDYAHRHGVIHRDIKPENILLHDGRPMVADFGIALALSAAAGGRMTETGLSLGTPYYMSPEQATADKDITARSDVYSLASVLYEMLAGEPPHMGNTAQQIIMKIIAEPVQPVTALRKSVPPNVTAAVAKALEKLPADRFGTAKAFAAALGDPTFAVATVPAATRPGRHSPWGWNRLSVVIVGLAALLAAVAVAGWLRPVTSPPPAVPTRSSLTGLQLGGLGKRLAISRDGSTIAAVGWADGMSHIFVRTAADLEWRQLENTEGGSSPDFSPDGEWIVFGTGANGISKIPVVGGPALRLMSDVGVFDPQWTDDETIVFWVEPSGDIYRIGSAGGDSELLFHSDTLTPSGARLLPNGRGVLFGTRTNGDALNARVYVYDIAADEVREIASSGNQPRYVQPGYVIFGHGDQVLMGVPFDLATLRVTGAPVTLLPTLTVQSSGASQFAVSSNGTLLYEARPAPVGGDLQLIDVAMDGTVTELPIRGTDIRLPRYSPDGTRIAYETQMASGSETRIHDLRTGSDRQLTTGGGDIPVWSASGERVYFTRDSGGYRRQADFSAPASRVFSAGGVDNWIADVSADERLIVGWDGGADLSVSSDLYLVRDAGDSVVVQDLLATDAWEAQAEISPDGRWLAYVSDESGEKRVYVNTFPEFTSPRAVSPGYGVEPVWSPDGMAIYYRDGTRLFVVDVSTAPVFGTSAPRLLFDRPAYLTRAGDLFRNWDLHPDGTRFVMVAPAVDRAGGPDDLRIVVNWFEELKAKMQQ